MTKFVQVAALVFVTALAAVACKPADSGTSTTETKMTTTDNNAVPAVPESSNTSTTATKTSS